MPKIVIIGAGASGIAAATKLWENGFDDITILEAENRVGGRICSVEFGGTLVDIGGQWVHGEKGNLVYEMVKDLNLLSPSQLPQDTRMSFFLLNGTKAKTAITDKLFDIAISVKDDQECAKNHGGSFADYFTTEYSRRVDKEFDKSHIEAFELSVLVLQWFKKYMVLLNSAEYWNQLSTTSHYVFKPCEGHQMWGWRNKGYKTIIDVMMKNIPDKTLPILLNKEVYKIVWDPNDDGKVTVKCADGSFYQCNHVIVTVSVGVLKDVYKKMFVPALPEYKVNSIEHVPLGTVNKILLKFPRKWWPDNMADISFLWSEEQRKELIEEYPHGPVVNGRSWLENLFTFTAIDSHPSVLLGWINGPTAKLVELLPDDVVQQGAMFMLRKFAGKLFDIPEPDSILRSKWGSNPHFRGSYTFISADMEKNKASAKDLSEPILVADKPTIQFAGEATHEYLFSTVNGAMETGYREADRIIAYYKKCNET